MNKIYFSIDTSMCGFPILKQPKDNWRMRISTIVHNYAVYRFKLNNASVCERKFRKSLVNNIRRGITLYNSRNYSYLMKALIVSLIQNQKHDYVVLRTGKSWQTAIIDYNTCEVYLNGSAPQGKYKFFFQTLKTSHANHIDVKIWDPNFIISKTEIEAVAKRNELNYYDNIKLLKLNPKPISIKFNKYMILISFDENEKGTESISDDLEIFSKNHLKVEVRKIK